MASDLNVPQQIEQQLEKLRKWQEEQKRILIEKQNAQRQMLGYEQAKMYEMLGLNQSPVPSSSKCINVEQGKSNLGDLEEGISHLSVNEVQDDQDHYEKRESKVPKRPFLKRGQGLISRFKINPDALRLNNLPKYKFANAHKNLSQNKQKVNQKKKSENASSQWKPKHQLTLEKPNPVANSPPLRHETENISGCDNQDENKTDQPIAEPEDPLSWAQVLDPKIIKPISAQRRLLPTSLSSVPDNDETDKLSIFELLERKAEEGSFDLNDSCIKRWIQSKARSDIDQDETDSTIDACIQNPRRISPSPKEVEEELAYSSSSSEYDEEPKMPRVRFSENIEVNEVETDNEISAYGSNKTSTPNDKLPFEKFRTELFNEVTNDSSNFVEASDSTLIEEQKKEIQDKTNLLKVRLTELEQEIATFKQNNLELLKLKQAHELEKAQLEHEKREMQEKLNDEQIKIEIYLHDERMKIEEERKKIDKLIRDQRIPNRKEREEITKLKEENEQLQKELKSKDSKHVSAQARLRAQLRNYEKDIKELNSKIDDMKVEIKRLENENLMLNRQNNNKMLKEINRNIAKLTQKESSEPTPLPAAEIRNKSSKSITARVVSHKRQSTGNSSRKIPKSKISSNLNVSDSSDSSETREEDTEEQDSSEKSTYFPQEKITSKSNRNSVKTPPRPSNINQNQSNEIEFKREILNPDGSKDIWYPNGNLKKISADEMIIRMLYFNKDIKETNINDGTVKYYYAETNTWHTTYLDGLEILEFPNGQTEHRQKDGTVEIHFPNGSVKITNPSDTEKLEEWRYHDGTHLIEMRNGDKILSLSNGQKEIHTKLHKRREYPDGTVKLVYPDGSQETRYSNGRVRLKDKDGNLVMDSVNIKY